MQRATSPPRNGDVANHFNVQAWRIGVKNPLPQKEGRAIVNGSASICCARKRMRQYL
jgi:hypothetical protein